MAITYPVTPPAQGFSNITVHRGTAGGLTPSPYTAMQEVYAYPGQWWAADLVFCPAGLTRAGAVEAFLGQLNGTFGTFYLGDPRRKTPLGSASVTPGTPVVNGAQAIGSKTLSLRGLPISATQYLKMGDYIQLGSGANCRLYQTITDTNTDGSGHATLDLWPYLRDVANDGDVVVVSNCQGRFRLTDAKPSVVLSPGPILNCQISAIEDLTS